MLNKEEKHENKIQQNITGLFTVKNDVSGFCQPGVLISLLNAFPPEDQNP